MRISDWSSDVCSSDLTVEAARATLRARVHLVTRQADGPWRAALPADAVRQAGETGWRFILPPEGIETLLGQLIAGGAGIETLSLERPSTHDAFVAIVGRRAVEDESLAAGETSAPQQRHPDARSARTSRRAPSRPYPKGPQHNE